MRRVELENWEFVTKRLHVGPWHSSDYYSDVDLPDLVAQILTEGSTTALPDSWQGDFSVERANAWIKERDRESPTLLGIERTSGRAVALVIVHEIALDDSAVDVRIGYVLAEAAWSRGLATELVGGLVKWARTQPSVHTLTGGVDTANQASIRVLVKNSFELVGVGEHGDATYQLRVDSAL